MAVLRWRRSLDEAINRCLKKAAIEAELRIVLRLALAEIVEIGVPAPVAGDAAVRLVRQMGKGRAAGLVNAVIRRAPGWWAKIMEDAPPDLKYSHPEWIWRRWRENFGGEAAEAAMREAQKPAGLWAWFLEDAPDLEGLVAHPWLDGAISARARELLPVLKAGDAYAMDPSSQLIAHLVAKVHPAARRVLDLCAAPGGKAARIAKFNPGLDVVAADLSLGRLGLGRSLFERAGVAAAVVSDAGSPVFAAESFDLVLLDAPCSGSGTFRRHPELKDRLRPEDIKGRAELHGRLISSALELVAPGGTLLYSTCSIEPEENEGHFQQIPEEFEVLPPGEYLSEAVPWIETDSGGGRLIPGSDWDGFSFQLLRKK